MSSRYLLDTAFTRFPNYIFTMLKPSKDYGASKVVFKVPLQVNKLIIKNYVEELYNVKIDKVNTMIYQGKSKRDRDGRPIKRPDWKKAIITLADGKEFKFPSLDQMKAYNKPKIALTQEQHQLVTQQQPQQVKPEDNTNASSEQTKL
jgi:large subunit ribosomal protein L23